jgi:4-amino-4-deoxy-L-arabinose transferase-like glycosyltransferase
VTRASVPPADRPLGPRTGLLILAALGLYLGTRLPALTVLPIFLDETQHIRWAMEIASGEKWHRPWNYGKGLSVFANALVFPWASDEYLYWSRMVGVAFGALSLLAGMAAARALFGLSQALVFVALYLTCPFAFFYDRLALSDPPMAACAALVLLVSVRLGWAPSFGRTIVLAATLVLTVLTKANGLLAFGIPLAAFLILDRWEPRRLRAFGGAVLVAALGLAWPLHRFFATTATVRLGVGHRDVDLLPRFAANMTEALSWLLAYFTWPLLLLALAGLAFGAVERRRDVFFLACVVALPVVAFAAVSTLWFPRYLVLVVVPTLLLAAFGFTRLWSWLRGLTRGLGLLLPLLLLPALRFDYALLRDPTKAPLPDIDGTQFVSGWPSGYGTEEVLSFVREELRHHPRGVSVVVHVHSRRTTFAALGLEFAREPRVSLRDLDLTQPANLEILAAWAHSHTTLLVVPPVGPSRRPPEPATWAHLGSLALRACRPRPGDCERVYRLDAGRSAWASPGRPGS